MSTHQARPAVAGDAREFGPARRCPPCTSSRQDRDSVCGLAAQPNILLRADRGLVMVWALRLAHALGYAMRVAGNPAAALYAYIAPARVTIGAMLLSGALAGGLGLNELLGSQHRILIDFPGGAGWVFVGIAVALMAATIRPASCSWPCSSARSLPRRRSSPSTCRRSTATWSW